MLMNENFELFEDQMGLALNSWSRLMSLHENNSFNLYWKKQVLPMMLISVIHTQKRRYKTALKSIYAAQTIVSELDETVERNLDYLMALNTLTAYVLLSIDKTSECLEFVQIAERICYYLA